MGTALAVLEGAFTFHRHTEVQYAAGTPMRRHSPRKGYAVNHERTDNGRQRNRLNGVKGFTLVELLVVMAIIAMLAALVGPKLFPKLGKGKQAAAKAQIELLGQALDQYRLDVGRYPTTQETLTSLVSSPGIDGWDGPYLKKALPADPWGRPYVYTCPGSYGEYDLVSHGRDGQTGGEGEDKDINSWE